MGFRQGAYATIWEVEALSDVNTKARISISRKNKQTGEYETDFSGYVNFIGTAAAKKASCLKGKDRVKLGDVDLTTKYDAEKKITYYNPKIFSFETQDELDGKAAPAADPAPKKPVDDGEVDDSRLPF